MPNVGAGYVRPSFLALPATPVGPSRFAPILPLPGVPTVVGLQLGVPAGARACFARLDLGSFREFPDGGHS